MSNIFSKFFNREASTPVAAPLWETRLESALRESRPLGDALGLVGTWAMSLPGVSATELSLSSTSDLESKKQGGGLSSIVLGNPAALAERSSKYKTITAPITFGGMELGLIKVAAPKDIQIDEEEVRKLAKFGSIVVMNAQYAREFLSMRNISEQIANERTGFLAALSHEIRGPLGIMMNAVELVTDGLCGELPKDADDVLKMVRGNGQHLLGLINDVLDYAKVEAGKMRPESINFDIGEIAQELVSTVTPQANTKKHSIKLIKKSEDDAKVVRADIRHVRQIIINILTNAIKYTPEGGQIEVWVESRDAAHVVCIKDSGVGIAAEDIQKVFAPFERIEKGYSMDQRGTGLGMPLARKLAEANGGKLDFISAVGKGSTFFVELPIGGALTKNESKNITVDGGGTRVIYLAIPSVFDGGVSRTYLSSKGFGVSPVASVREAISLTKANPSGIIIVDAAAECEEEIRQLRGSLPEGMPILLVTSYAFHFDTERYLTIGVDRCIARPFELHELGQACVLLSKSAR